MKKYYIHTIWRNPEGCVDEPYMIHCIDDNEGPLEEIRDEDEFDLWCLNHEVDRFGNKLAPTIEEQFVDAIRDGEGYQFICDYGHKLSAYTLTEIIKEALFAGKNMSDKYGQTFNELFAKGIIDNIIE